MEATNPTLLTEVQDLTRAATEQLSDLFGSYKAEWLRERIFDLFAEPAYFPELMTPRPCMLIGGRGTGKTTVLRCLSYQGQFAIKKKDQQAVNSWPFYGFYYRVNTNRVTAFAGPEMQAQEWGKYFAHYVNLELTDLVLRFLDWYRQQRPAEATLGIDSCRRVAISLNLKGVDSLSSLILTLGEARLRFEALLNSAADKEQVVDLSLQGGPIDTLFAEIETLPQFADKQFFYLLDEYENLADYQQQIFNTLIKHCGERYSFKIGVRELGFRIRSTLNPHEQLVSPADYVVINIPEKLGPHFTDFAASVCNDRLKRLNIGAGTINDVRQLFGQLSEDQEAELLEIRGRLAEIRTALRERLNDDEIHAFDQLRPLHAYFLAYWATAKRIPVAHVVRSYIAEDRTIWDDRFENHGFASLFTLRRGKRGIHKYFAGWDVYVQLAAGNIRYLLELVEQSLLKHLRLDQRLATQVPFDIQTEAAQAVGRKNLTELDGLSVQGARLTRLLLGLGRVFQVMAAQPEGHTPEANQFSLRPDQDLSTDDKKSAKVEALLRDAVMHLALIRFPGNKLQDPSETRAFDYMIHPIFSAFFEFSYRRKRKILLSVNEIIGLVEAHRKTIPEILKKHNRPETGELPEQLRLFGEFYAGSK